MHVVKNCTVCVIILHTVTLRTGHNGDTVREVAEEVMAEDNADAPQQIRVYIVAAEYVVHVAPVAMKLLREPCHGVASRMTFEFVAY